MILIALLYAAIAAWLFHVAAAAAAAGDMGEALSVAIPAVLVAVCALVIASEAA